MAKKPAKKSTAQSASKAPKPAKKESEKKAAAPKKPAAKKAPPMKKSMSRSHGEEE